MQPTIAELRNSADRIRSITTIRSRPGRSSRTGAFSMFSSRKLRLLLGAGNRRERAQSPARLHKPGHFGYGQKSDARTDGRMGDRRARRGWRGASPGQWHGREGRRTFWGSMRRLPWNFRRRRGPFPKLAGGAGTLRNDRPELTVGSYWPFAPTLWDYINRAMPMAAPSTLSADDVYALTAYILNLTNSFRMNSLPIATAYRK